MIYKATVIDGYTFKQIDNMSSDDNFRFEQICYDYPLIFIPNEPAIIYFNFRVNLDRMHYNLLYYLVQNATEKKNDKGISALCLFKHLGCKHTREKSRQNLTEEQRANERIKDLKRRIREAVKKAYTSLEQKLVSSSFNANGITVLENKKFFNGSFEIEDSSPYYNFEIDSAIDLLIVNQSNPNKKYTTFFAF